jgi:hypothetical protein
MACCAATAGKTNARRRPLACILGYDEDIIAGPGGRGYAEVVAEFAGTSGGQFVEPEGVEGSDEIGGRVRSFDISGHRGIPVRSF